MTPPILRSAQSRAAELRDSTEEDAGMPVMTVRYSALDTPYEIHSYYEGDFQERVSPGAFDGHEPSSVKVLFNHGHDSSLGGRALGVPTDLYERDGYACADVPLFDTSYVRDLLPGIRAGAYGSSFMFEVTAESWQRHVEADATNPKGLPVRTITGVRLFEAGPVTFPANPAADVQINSQSSMTDWYYRELERSEALSAETRDALTALRREDSPKVLPPWARARVLREMELRRWTSLH